MTPNELAFGALAVFNVIVVAAVIRWSMVSMARRDREHDEADLRFRQMAEHIREAFFVVDLDANQPLYISPTWSEFSGRPVAEGYDRAVWESAIHPDDRERMTATLATIRAGEPTDDEYRMLRPDGTIRWVHGRAFPVRDQRGRVYRLVGLSADITALRQAQERFAQSERLEAVGRLAGGVAHDFNNLLTVILGEADMLRRRLRSADPNLAAVDNIDRAAQSAVGLTRQLLAFSRKQLIEPTVFNLSDLVVETTSMVGRLIGEHVQLATRLEPGSFCVRADRGQIEQVLTNLAVNARDAMPTGGILTVGVSGVSLTDDYTNTHQPLSAGEYVLLTVSDTGIGMSEDVRLHAFDPFFSTKARGSGTGLGLATSLGIVRQAGGDISVYSELGIGTTIRIHLPLVDDGEANVLHVDADDVPNGTETVLVLEDDEGVRRVVSRLLRELGYRVLEAGEGRRAQEILSRDGADVSLLFTDVVLPGMPGREVAEWTQRHYPHIRVLFTTGYTDDVVLQHELIAHHVTVLNKPYSRGDLARKVRQALG